MRGGLVLFGVASLLAAPGVAHAGRSFFGWLVGTEVMPERSVELQNWVDEQNVIEDEADRSVSLWGVGPLIGVTDRLEVFLPLDIRWARVPGMPGTTALYDYGVEARYRLVTQDPEEAPAFVPLVRAGVKRLVLARDTMRPELGVVMSYEAGRVFVAADLNVAAEISRDDTQLEARPAAGVSVLVGADVRLGAEVVSYLSFEDGGTQWVSAGPSMSWTHGRFWLSASFGIGLYHVKDTPRMQWGIAF